MHIDFWRNLFAVVVFCCVFFTLTSCSIQFYEKLGYPESEAEALHLEDLANAQTGFEKVRVTAWQAAATVINALLAAGVAALWRKLGKEKKINGALIDTVEATNSKEIKEAAKTNAIAKGVEDELHKRVKANGG